MLIKRSGYVETEVKIAKQLHKCNKCGKPVVCDENSCELTCPECQAKELKKATEKV